jgi:hypothetical protein
MLVRRFGRMAAISVISVAAAAAAVIPIAAAASAQTAAPAHVGVLTAHQGSPGATAGAAAATAGDTSAITTDETLGGTDSAGDPCKTNTVTIRYNDVFGVNLWWFKMSTYWCWNYSIVTYHSTSVSHGVTGTGDATGWAWGGGSGPHFNCYVASGSSRNCSGNYEYATGKFDYIPIPSVCAEEIQEWENYKGSFYWSTSKSSC